MRAAPLVLLVAAAWLWRRMKDELPTKPDLPRGNVSREDRAAILRELSALGWPADELEHCIAIESGWRTTARNRISDASGLIQLMPAWFMRQRFRVDLPTGRERAAAFRELSALDQLPWIRRYFVEVARPWLVPGDTYLALAAPSHVGAPNDHVIYAVGSKAWQQNPIWRESAMGPITAGSIRRTLLRRMKGSNRG